MGLTDIGVAAVKLLPPEAAHTATIKALEKGLGVPLKAPAIDPILATTLPKSGLTFAGPVGLAAGFDKNCEVPSSVARFGFGFIECGTVTPLPQPGNPTPRVFRLKADRALINRLGFNNGGHAAALARLEKRGATGIVGVNVGANKDAADRVADYVAGIHCFYDVASYFTVNISSPNTPGLRDLQAPAALDELLGRVMEACAAQIAAGKPRRPIVVKIAPDVAEEDVPAIAERLMLHKVDAIAATNTTLSRKGVSHIPTSKEAGGLSGRPLFHRSTAMLARVHQATGGTVPLIGIGGIDSPERALEKIEAGASLLQLYTGLIYEGPSLIGRIKQHLDATCRTRGLANISGIVGTRAAEWAAKPLDA
jgi:dihydroorotate dehydrogenase